MSQWRWRMPARIGLAMMCLLAPALARAALTSVSLTAAPPSPQAIGTAVTFTAAAAGGANVEYAFRAQYADAGGRTVFPSLRGYSTDPTFVWTPPLATTYQVYVGAREVGSTASYQVLTSIPYVVTAGSSPLTGVELAVSPASPQPAGTRVTLTATAIGGADVQYRFRAGRLVNGVPQWQVLQSGGPAATCPWTPAAEGAYLLEVSARDTGDARIVSAQANYTVTTSSPPPPAPAGGRIAFISSRDGNPEIYVMNADGSNPRRLTNNTAVDLEVAWRPNGQALVFASRAPGNYELYRVNPDGSNLTRLTVNGRADWGPAYTPDGARLLCFRTINGTDEIFSMNPDGTGERQLTFNAWFDVLPVMTPDGTKIIFNSDRNGSVRQANYDLYSMNPDGSGQTRLTDNPGRDWYHAISPDGRTIAYTRDDHIALMNLDGSNTRQLTFPTGYQDTRPTFSPDGRAIAFASNRTGVWQIYRMNIDGSNQTRVTNTAWNETEPCWGP